MVALALIMEYHMLVDNPWFDFIGKRFSKTVTFTELNLISNSHTVNYATSRAKLLFGIPEEIFTPIIGLGGTVY